MKGIETDRERDKDKISENYGVFLLFRSQIARPKVQRITTWSTSQPEKRILRYITRILLRIKIFARRYGVVVFHGCCLLFFSSSLLTLFHRRCKCNCTYNMFCMVALGFINYYHCLLFYLSQFGASRSFRKYISINLFRSNCWVHVTFRLCTHNQPQATLAKIIIKILLPEYYMHNRDFWNIYCKSEMH